MRSPGRLTPVTVALSAIVAVAVAACGSSGSTRTVTTTVTQPASPGVSTSLATTSSSSIHQIYEKAGPSVVDIVVTTTAQTLLGGTQQSQGEGAGVVYDAKGDILTDEHVVANASSAKVTFQDGHTATAKVIGTDPSTDVGVIRVSAPSSELHPLAFANSSTAQVGDPVVAIGSPFSLPETVTAGIVSQVGRSITAPNGFTIAGAIQTDAPINPGNSGGPLLDGSGKVLGLNDQIQTNSGSSAGIGFATPGNTVQRIANEIIAGRTPQHSYVGVELNPSSQGGAEISPASRAAGASVVSGSPADKAGLAPGDIVTAINGQKINTTEQFIETVDQYAPGTTITLTYTRGGASHTAKVTLGTRPRSAPGQQGPSEGGGGQTIP